MHTLGDDFFFLCERERLFFLAHKRTNDDTHDEVVVVAVDDDGVSYEIKKILKIIRKRQTYSLTYSSRVVA